MLYVNSTLLKNKLIFKFKKKEFPTELKVSLIYMFILFGIHRSVPKATVESSGLHRNPNVSKTVRAHRILHELPYISQYIWGHKTNSSPRTLSGNACHFQDKGVESQCTSTISVFPTTTTTETTCSKFYSGKME